VMEQFFDFFMVDKIVFFVVENGDEHIEMGEQVLETDVAFDGDHIIGALAPFWKCFVEGCGLW